MNEDRCHPDDIWDLFRYRDIAAHKEFITLRMALAPSGRCLYRKLGEYGSSHYYLVREGGEVTPLKNLDQAWALLEFTGVVE